MEITWYARDGYCGDGPQSLEIDEDDIKGCSTAEEAFDLIESAIQEDFQQKVSWSWDREDVASAVQELIGRSVEDGEDD